MGLKNNWPVCTARPSAGPPYVRLPIRLEGPNSSVLEIGCSKYLPISGVQHGLVRESQRDSNFTQFVTQFILATYIAEHSSVNCCSREHGTSPRYNNGRYGRFLSISNNSHTGRHGRSRFSSRESVSSPSCFRSRPPATRGPYCLALPIRCCPHVITNHISISLTRKEVRSERPAGAHMIKLYSQTYRSPRTDGTKRMGAR